MLMAHPLANPPTSFSTITTLQLTSTTTVGESLHAKKALVSFLFSDYFSGTQKAEGEVQTTVKKASNSWLLIATGHNGKPTNKVEVVSLDPVGYPVPNCHRILRPFPFPNWGTASAILTEST